MGAPLIFAGFKGIVPKLSKRMLPAMAGQAATNIKTSSGEVQPYRAPKIVLKPNKPMPPIGIYRPVYDQNTAWYSWPYDVDTVRFQLAPGIEPRFGWTGDGEPRWGSYWYALTGGGSNYPAAFYALGIPNPINKPTVTPSATGSGATITRFYLETFFSKDGEESGPGPVSLGTNGKVDDTWNIANLSPFPANSGVGTAAFAVGETTFTNTGTAPTWLRVGDEIVIGTDKVVVTACPAAHQFKVSGNYSAATSWSRVAPWNTVGMKRRLYRTAGTAAGFQMVSDDVGLTFSDNLSDSAILGDELISDGWQPPPANLRGLFMTPFGSIGGFADNQFYLSEPMQPHAFKDVYSWTTDYEIVAAGISGVDIAVATTANLYVGIGSDPTNFALSKNNDAPYPCLSKRSMTSDGVGAIYATTHGIVYVSGGSAKIISGDFFTVDEWRPLNPETMFFEVAYGRIYMGYTDSNETQRILMFDTGTGDLFNLDIPAHSLYADETTGKLYIGTTEGIAEFDPADGAPMALEWHSKEVVLSSPVNLGVAKVEFDRAIDPAVKAAQQAAYDAAVAANTDMLTDGDIGGMFGVDAFGEVAWAGDTLLEIPDLPAENTVTFTLFSDGVQKHSRVVSSSEPFVLPAGYKSDTYSVKVNSQCQIKRVILAETHKSLKQA